MIIFVIQPVCGRLNSRGKAHWSILRQSQADRSYLPGGFFDHTSTVKWWAKTHPSGAVVCLLRFWLNLVVRVGIGWRFCGRTWRLYVVVFSGVLVGGGVLVCFGLRFCEFGDPGISGCLKVCDKGVAYDIASVLDFVLEGTSPSFRTEDAEYAGSFGQVLLDGFLGVGMLELEHKFFGCQIADVGIPEVLWFHGCIVAKRRCALKLGGTHEGRKRRREEAAR